MTPIVKGNTCAIYASRQLRADGTCVFDYVCTSIDDPRCNLKKESNMSKNKKAGKREQATAPATQPAATTAKTATPKVERPKLDFTTEQVLKAVKAVGHPAVSREISDKLQIADADQGRAFVRARMAALIKDGKIKTSEPEGKSRAHFLYSLNE